MNIFRSMIIKSMGILLVGLTSLSGCGGGGSQPPANLNAADVIGSWKMVSFTPPGGASVDVSPYNISLVSTASAYTIVLPVSIPGGQSACTEYGTWTLSGNSLATMPIAGSTCGNSSSTQTLSISGTTMTKSDASGVEVYHRQTAAPINSSALVGTWKIAAVVNRGTGAATPTSSIVILDPSTYSLAQPNCSETGTWSVLESTLSFTPATGTCGNNSTYLEPVSWNDPLMLWTEAQNIGVLARLPDAPASLVATGTGSGISLSWQAVNGSVVYKVYRGTASGPLADKTQIFTAVTTSFEDTTAVSGITYYYQITASGTNGESLPSSEVSGTSAASPGPVTGLTATAGTGQVTLSWNAVSGATSYNIYYYSNGIGICHVFAPNIGAYDYSLTGWTQLTGSLITASPVIVTGTTAGICHQFMVTAVNAYGESLSMGYVNATP